jgi:hypothetical protein
VPLLLLPPLIVIALVALIPFALVQRYRMGTARQRARGWLASINVAGLVLSALMLLVGAALTNLWVPHTLRAAAIGLLAGAVLGSVGLRLTRWEPSHRDLHYTPNRWIVLGIMLLVTARLLYGVGRALHTWRAGIGDSSWLGAAGVPGTMAAGALIVGYYLIFWSGVRRRYRRHTNAH